MILTKPKSWKEIKDAIILWNLNNVFVVGCGECAAQCGTGGPEGIKKIIKNLENENIHVLGSLVIEEPCDQRQIIQEFRKMKDILNKTDGLIVAACGSGAQTIAEISEKPIIITTDTIMNAQTERIGIYHEKCSACGTCWLNETGGICPISTCTKSLLNGPCGGMKNGKCEVGQYTRPCAWVKIYEKLKAQNKLDLFYRYRIPRNWGLKEINRDTDVRGKMKSYYDE